MRTRIEEATMKLLKINDEHKAFFRKGDEFIPITSIERDDLVLLIDFVAADNEIEMDAITKENHIEDPTAKLIYEHVFAALNDLVAHRDDYLKQWREEFELLKAHYGIAEKKDSE